MTLSSACARAWSVGTRSAWKLEISSTHTSKGWPTTSAGGVPKLPPTKVRRPAAASIAPTSAVVVLLPLVPPMRAMGPSKKREASSSSPITSRPLRSKAVERGERGHARRDHREVGAGEDRLRVPAEDERGAPLFQREHGRRGALARRRVGADDARAAGEQELAGGHAAAPEPHHHRGLAGDVHHPHLSLSDASETSARRMEMIQKRTMILGSAHPFFS